MNEYLEAIDHPLYKWTRKLSTYERRQLPACNRPSAYQDKIYTSQDVPRPLQNIFRLKINR